MLPISRLRAPRYAAGNAKLAIVTTLTETGRSDYALRAELYSRFAEGVRRIGAPLFTFETVRPGTDFATEDDGTSVRFRREAAPHLWQKEHQLNFLICRLPLQYDYVAWLDADILYEHDAWAAATEILLETHGVVHMYDRAKWLGPDGEPIYIYRSCLDPSLNGTREIQVVGFAWGAQRSLLEAAGGLYSRGGAGSNDAIMASAFCGIDPDNYAAGRSQSARHWIATAKKAGRATWLKGHTLQHLWHGSIRSRRYLQWDRDLIDAGYDADRDVIVDEGPELRTTRLDLAQVLRRHGCV